MAAISLLSGKSGVMAFFYERCRSDAKARRHLASARYLLTGGFIEQAGRDAYLAGYQAAHTLVVHRTGRSPKTHSGTRSEFARLARDDRRIGRTLVAFLGWAYEMKTAADYGIEQPVTTDEAERAIGEAEQVVDLVEELLANK